MCKLSELIVQKLNSLRDQYTGEFRVYNNIIFSTYQVPGGLRTIKIFVDLESVQISLRDRPNYPDGARTSSIGIIYNEAPNSRSLPRFEIADPIFYKKIMGYVRKDDFEWVEIYDCFTKRKIQDLEVLSWYLW